MIADDDLSVLYLHGLRGRPYTGKHVVLRRTLGDSRVFCPDLKTAHAYYFWISFVVVVGVLLGIISA